MPEIARGSGKDSVTTGHGCDATTVTDQCSGDFIVDGVGVVRKGDLVKPHLIESGSDCVIHVVALDTGYSEKVIVNNLPCAVKGSAYGGTHEIITGHDKVDIGL